MLPIYKYFYIWKIPCSHPVRWWNDCPICSYWIDLCSEIRMSSDRSKEKKIRIESLLKNHWDKYRLHLKHHGHQK